MPKQEGAGGGTEPLMKMVEYATKALALIALSAYSLGLIITNTWLYYKGVSEFELFRPRFVTTGLLGLTLLALSATGIVAIGWALFSPGLQSDAPRITRAFVSLIAWVLAVALALAPYRLLQFMLDPRDRPVPAAGVSSEKLLLIYALGFAASGGFLLAWRKLKADRSWGASVPATASSRWRVTKWALRQVERVRAWAARETQAPHGSVAVPRVRGCLRGMDPSILKGGVPAPSRGVWREPREAGPAPHR